MREKCKKLYAELSRLKEKRAEFGRVYEDGLHKREFGECRGLFREIRNMLDEPESEIGKIRGLAVLRQLKLKEQYESQAEVARKSGLFDTPDSVRVANPDLTAAHRLPVIERGGKKYQMPSWKEVQSTLRKPENREIIKEKSAQGFTKMLIVPFGYDLKTMAGKFKDKVRELDQAGLNPHGSSNPNKGIFGAGGEKVEFDRNSDNYPVQIWEGWDEDRLVYFPKQYDQQNHGGLSKDDVIKIKGVWQICFVEDMPVIPEEGKEIGGRKQIDRKGSCIKGQTEIPEIQQFHTAMQDKEMMEDSANYRHERGQTCEQYLWMQLTSLLDNEKPVLMDYENGEWRGTGLIESYNPLSHIILVPNWFGECRIFSLSGCLSENRDANCGLRPSVSIK